MDSSSDESFLWEKASSGSDDTDKVHSKMNGAESEIEVKHEKSDYNVKEDNNAAKEQKPKKRKNTDEENSFDQVESPKKKRIKTEPESDSDARKKKKKKSNISNGYLNNSVESDQHDNDEYLNMRVKLEEKYLEPPNPVKSKKSKKQHKNCLDKIDSSQEKEWDDHIPKKEKKSKKKKTHSSNDISAINDSENGLHNNENNSDYIDNYVEEMHQPSRKSPKKKKSKESRLSERFESPDIEDKFKTEETIVKKNHNHLNISEINNYSNNEQIGNEHSSNLEYSMNESRTELNSHTSLKKQLQNTMNNEMATLQNGSPKKEISIKPTVQSTPINIAIQSKKKSGSILDRIRFEDDPDSDTDITQKSDDTLSYLKKYLKLNENLQPISEGFQNGSEITNDDEIWIMKCPHNIDIQQLHDTDFNLDSKSKIKINGETYCGNLDKNESNITIITSNKHKFVIKNTVANGTINFRKRLPKPHVHDGNIMVNNQTDFIPLPETKCRHPLFGSNYKDAINVHMRRARAESAATDLELSTTHEKRRKKKHKKDHSLKPKVEMDIDILLKKSLKMENDSDVPVKKAKKRKHTSNDESFKKKPKRIKLEPDSAEAWESEKAIEENLFNF